MALRSSWKASLRLSLVCVPVKAYPAAASGNGEIRFHQLHADCGCRIQYQKRCPQHGQIASDEIVSGYEYVRDQYVVIEAAELDNLHGPSEPIETACSSSLRTSPDSFSLAIKSWGFLLACRIAKHRATGVCGTSLPRIFKSHAIESGSVRIAASAFAFCILSSAVSPSASCCRSLSCSCC